MVHIAEFRAKWQFYKPRACKISTHFAEFHEGAKITQDVVAARIPKDVASRIPASGGENVAGAAFGNWLATESVPDNRVRQWQDLTGLPIDTWTDPLQSFERALRQKTGEILGWSDLVQVQAKRGRLRVRPQDRNVQQNAGASPVRFTPDAFDPDERPVDLQLVWPGCIADVVVPTRESREDEDRRAWLLADYGDRVFMLDPSKPAAGAASSSRIDKRCWRPHQRGGRNEGYVVLPRAAPGHVWIPPSAHLGTRFEVIVLTLNLTPQPDEIRGLFDALERGWLVDIRDIPAEDYQKTVRATLEEAAALIEGHDVRQSIYAQACEIVDRATAMEAGRT
jgi:hypothetical protein